MKLYNLYSVVSNKTVRHNERFYKRYPSHKFVPGILVQTNRGFFIDGKHVDVKSATLHQDLVSSAKKGGITAPMWNPEPKSE